VWLAFWIQRRHEDQQATARYAAQLYGCRQELLELGERAEKLQRRINPGGAIIASFEAPALQALLGSPEIARQSGHGFFVAAISLLNQFKAVENTLNYLRLTAAAGQHLTAGQAAHTARELGVAERANAYVVNLIDGELSKLEHAVKPSAQDEQIIAELMRVARGEEDDG
jgi:hypothetical protein